MKIRYFQVLVWSRLVWSRVPKRTAFGMAKPPRSAVPSRPGELGQLGPLTRIGMEADTKPCVT